MYVLITYTSIPFWGEISEDHAAHLGHWLTVLKEFKPAIFSVAARAQRAADYLNTLQQKQESAEAKELLLSLTARLAGVPWHHILISGYMLI